ncbi:MAG TPA: hypothetical protein V6C57_29055, partial [Coleofasciculaceae cyanobacterium]
MNDTNSSQQPQPSAATYQYNYNYIESVAMVDQLPPGENFSQPWLILAGQQAIKLAINTLIVNQGDRGKAGIEDDVRAFLSRILLQTLQETGKSFKSNLVYALVGLLPPLLLNNPSSKTAVTVSRTVEAVSRSASSSAEADVTVSTTVEASLQSPALAASLSDLESAKSIEAALQQLLESPSSDDLATARGGEPALQYAAPPLAAPLPAETEIAVSRGLEQALQKPLPGMPSNEAEVEKFVASNLIKVLGEDFLKCFANNLLNGMKDKAPTGRPSSLEDYRQLFAYIDLPKSAALVRDDEFFASMRVAGPNPVMIERMTAADPRFPVTESHYKAVMGNEDSLETALQQGRVYLADYAVLDGALNGTYGTQPQTQKYAYAPLAMFAVPAATAAQRRLR